MHSNKFIKEKQKPKWKGKEREKYTTPILNGALALTNQQFL